MMTHDEMINVISAHKQGKKLEVRATKGPYLDGIWRNCVTPKFDFAHFEYRIKPEPREWWFDPLNGHFYIVKPYGDSYKLIHVREVMED